MYTDIVKPAFYYFITLKKSLKIKTNIKDSNQNKRKKEGRDQTGDEMNLKKLYLLPHER